MKNIDFFDIEYKKEVISIALFAGEIMLKNGGETYRVEDTIKRMCKSKGFEHINVFVSPTVIIISDERYDGLTFMKTIKHRIINIDIVDKINSFSREFCNKDRVNKIEEIQFLKKIQEGLLYDDKKIILNVGIGCSAFSLLFGADLIGMIITFFITVIGMICFKKIYYLSENDILSTMAIAGLTGIATIILFEMHYLKTTDAVIISSLMPYLPGVALTKSARDLMSGDLIAGISRIFEATLIALALASGLGSIVMIWISFGGGF